ncbi:MAG: hypothetical protein H7Z19_19525 [Chitinophagaceae bacterium]|nr:hypothetical protein [Rubrivivax sp.]
MNNDKRDIDDNRDPISGAPGAQPRCVEPELGQGQVRGARRLEPHQPDVLTQCA